MPPQPHRCCSPAARLDAGLFCFFCITPECSCVKFCFNSTLWTCAFVLCLLCILLPVNKLPCSNLWFVALYVSVCLLVSVLLLLRADSWGAAIRLPCPPPLRIRSRTQGLTSGMFLVLLADACCAFVPAAAPLFFSLCLHVRVVVRITRHTQELCVCFVA